MEWISVLLELPKKKCLAFYLNKLGNGRTVVAFYAKQFERESGSDDEWFEYSELNDCYYLKQGWYECIDNWDDYTSVTINEGVVTHWMPLPDEPK